MSPITRERTIWEVAETILAGPDGREGKGRKMEDNEQKYVNPDDAREEMLASRLRKLVGHLRMARAIDAASRAQGTPFSEILVHEMREFLRIAASKPGTSGSCSRSGRGG